MSNIHNYPLTAAQINDEDFYDVDYWNGVSYETRKISGASLKSILGGAENLNDLLDVDTQLPLTPTNADDGRILYFDIDTGKWISDDIANIANVVKDCKTTAGNTIPKGTPIALVGFDNDLLVVEPADAGNPALMPCIGIAAETIDDTNAKKAVSFGKLQGIDTSLFSANAVLYVGVGGGLTPIRPTGNAQIQRMVQILKSDNPGGIIKVFNSSRTAGLPNLQPGKIWHGDSDSYPEEIDLCPINLVDLDPGDIIAICRYNGVDFDRFGITGSSIIGLGANIYNINGSLDNNRTLTGADFDLSFIQLRRMLFQIAPPNGSEAFKIDVDTSSMSGGDALFEIFDIPGGSPVLQFIRSGLLVINNAYALPAADGNNGEVLTTDGAGNVSFQPVGSPEWIPPFFQLYDGTIAGGASTINGAGQGYYVVMNGTGTPGRISWNMPLNINGVSYDGSVCDIYLLWQMPTNGGGNVEIDTIFKFTTADGTTDARSLGTTDVTPINVTGRNTDALYRDKVAQISGAAGAHALTMSLIRATGGGLNNDTAHFIGIEIIKI